MKEKKIARSFDVTTVLYTPVLEDGSLGESATMTFPAILTQRDVIAHLLDVLPGVIGIRVDGLTTGKEKYSMTISDFLKYAERV